MESTETHNLVGKPAGDHPSDQPPPPPPNKTDDGHHRSPVTSNLHLLITDIIFEPFRWLQMLSSQLSPTFVAGVVLVYGLNQGFSGSFFRVVSDYYWKDVQRVQPSAVQLYAGLYSIPWVMKPLWGLLTDVFPVGGYRRRPYFVLAGVVGAFSAVAVAADGGMSAEEAVGCLMGLSAAVAIADVTIDACIARSSIEIRALASDLQSLCGFCSSAGALLGYSSSGFFIHHLVLREHWVFWLFHQLYYLFLDFSYMKKGRRPGPILRRRW